jgi:tRNA(Arg) A34 adenosine deaminase TadA
MTQRSPADFEASVERRLAALRERSLRDIEAEAAARRLAWLEARPGLRSAPLSPRRLFELLFLEYMGLDPADLPVRSESEREITWSSRNPCPTLEACARAGLSTAVVCKGAYERSTQAFLSWFDPRFRFLRDYAELRPAAAGCTERIVRVDVEGVMRLALDQARLSRRTGNKGYGAAVLLGERVLSCRHDTASSERDPSLHAELNAVRDAARALGTADLSGCVLVSTCEPCPMCSSLAVWANMGAVFFGASIQATAALGKARIRVPAREIAERSPVRLEVVGGILEEECMELYR